MNGHPEEPGGDDDGFRYRYWVYSYFLTTDGRAYPSISTLVIAPTCTVHHIKSACSGALHSLPSRPVRGATSSSH
eukprot:6738052-Pyramimonas_sp.AAC.1